MGRNKGSGLKVSSTAFTPLAKPHPPALLTDAPPLPNPWRYLPYLPLDAFGARAPEEVCSTFERLEVLRLISGDLAAALSLPDDAFAGTVLHNQSFVTLLDSFVRYAPRTHDAATGADEEAKVLDEASRDAEASVSGRVLRCVHRLVLGGAVAPALRTQLVEAALSLPALMDLCCIFGDQNPKLIRQLVRAAIAASPGLQAQLEPMAAHVHDLLSKMCQQASAAVLDTSSAHELVHIAVSLAMLFSADATTVRPFAALAVHQHGIGDESWNFVTLLSFLHHQVAPLLSREIGGSSIQLEVVQTSLMDVAHAVLHECIAQYLPDVKGAALKRAQSSGENEELMYSLVPLMALHSGLCPEDLIETSSEALSEGNSMLASLCVHWHFLTLLERLSEAQGLDQARIEYSIGLIHDLVEPDLELPERIFPPAPEGAPPARPPDAAEKAANLQEQLQREQANAQREKEQFVLDMMPDTDKELVRRGLEYYRGEVDQFIQALMEGNLPPALSAPVAGAAAEEPVLSARRGNTTQFDGDAFDTAAVLPANVAWMGKSSTDQFRRGDAGAGVNVEAILQTQWEEEKEIDAENKRVQYDPEYDDDYDDAYDEVPSFGIAEAGTSDIGKKEAEEEEEDEEEEAAESRTHGGGKGKGGGKGGGEQGRGRGGGKGKGWRGAGRGQVVANKKKEQNKAQFANHNRRRGADKKAKGMVG